MTKNYDNKAPQGREEKVVGETTDTAQIKEDETYAEGDVPKRDGTNDSIASKQPRDKDALKEGRTGPNDSFPSDEPVSYYVAKEDGGHGDPRGEATAEREDAETRDEK